MKIEKLAVAVAVALPLALAGAANAAALGTITNDITEGGPNPQNPFPGSGSADSVGDFGQPGDETTFTVGANLLNIFGTIAHNTSELYQDAWTMTLEKVTEISFKWAPHTGSTFNGSILAGDLGTFGFGPLSGGFTDPDGMEVLGVLLPGTYNFSVDATAYGSPPERGHWQVQTQVVPLPAGGILLLTALGGLAAFRARKKA